MKEIIDSSIWGKSSVVKSYKFSARVSGSSRIYIATHIVAQECNDVVPEV